MQLHRSSALSALSVLVGLAFVVAAGAVVYWRNPAFPILSFVNGVSTLAVALLTVAYVLTTSGQLSVMNAQLVQMQRSRDFQAQPLPVAKIEKIELESPRAFYSPPEDDYSAQGRVFVYFKIINEGTHPAINVVSSGRLIIPRESGHKVFDCASILANVVPEGGTFPKTEDGAHFMFAADGDCEIIDALRRRDLRKQPVLAFRTIFSNALGSCFSATSLFQISVPDQETDNKLTAWHAALVAFPVRFITEIERLRKIREKDDEWTELFGEVKRNFGEQIPDKNNLALKCIGIPLSFRVEPMPEDEYEEEIKNKHFGSPIPHWVEGCLHEGRL